LSTEEALAFFATLQTFAPEGLNTVYGYSGINNVWQQ
jgi:hypothetical protein